MRLALLLLLPGIAAAATVRADVADLAAGTLPLVDGALPDLGTTAVTVRYDGEPVDVVTCTLGVHEDGLHREGPCLPVWSLLNPSTTPLPGLTTVTVQLVVPGIPEPIDVALAPVGSMAFAELSGSTLDVEVDEVFGLDPDLGWTVQDAQALEAPVRDLLADGQVSYVFASDRAVRVTMAPAQPAAPPPVPPPVVDVDVVTRDFCPEPEDRRELVLCWDLTGPEVVFRASNPRLVRKPHDRVVVAVLHDAADSIDIGMAGTPGVFRPGLRAGSELSGRGGPMRDFPAESMEFDDEEPPPVVTRARFAPRQPGDGAVTVSARRGTQAARVERHEPVIEETHAGALRTGLAAVMGGAVDGGWEARTLPGSDQAEIVSTRRGDMDIEIVVGVAPYLDRGGRSTSGCRRAPMCFEPLVGLGLLSPTPDGVEFLKSVHLGLEWEPTSTFSVAVTGVARRVDRLGDGLVVGSPVDGDPFVTSGYGLGLGLVVGFSPEAFKLASGGVL